MEEDYGCAGGEAGGYVVPLDGFVVSGCGDEVVGESYVVEDFCGTVCIGRSKLGIREVFLSLGYSSDGKE